MERRVKKRRLNPKDASDSDEEQSIRSEESSEDGSHDSEEYASEQIEAETEDSRDDEEQDVIQDELASIDFGTLAKAQKSLGKRLPTLSKPSKSQISHSRFTKPPQSESLSKSKPKSKNAPQEISSKQPVSRKHFLPMGQSQSYKSRDPRFDTLTNTVSQKSFRNAYSFLEDYQREEISMLKAQIRQSNDPDDREKLSKALQSLQSRKESREAKDRAQDVLRTRKRTEKEKVKHGKRPYYLKKSEEKKLVLEDKYSRLSKKRLEKILERKRKKKEGKEMRRMPRQR